MHKIALAFTLAFLGNCGKIEKISPQRPLATVIHVMDAQIRPPMQGHNMSVAYMRISATSADRLISASSPDIARIEIHDHQHLNGYMQMQRLESVALPAGEWVQFQPGGLHLMLFGLPPLQPEQILMLKLQFDSGATQTVPFRLK